MRKLLLSGLIKPKIILIMPSILALTISNEVFSLFVLLLWSTAGLLKFAEFLCESGLLDD